MKKRTSRKWVGDSMRLTFLLVVCVIIAVFSTNAQKIPEFKVRQPNGNIITADNLTHQKPVILIYFAPDCEHCQELIHNLFKFFNYFKNTEILMITFESDASVTDFIKQYHVDKYPNIKVGIEIPVFFFRKYYQIEQTPFTALFDRNHHLVISYKNYTPLSDLIEHVNRLK